MAQTDTEDYAESELVGSAQDSRAVVHRREALDALALSEPAHVALTHALLALEARVDELTCYVAGQG